MAKPITAMESLKEIFFSMIRARMSHCKKELATALTSEFVELTEDGFKWPSGHFSFHAYRSMMSMLFKENDFSWESLFEEPEFEICLNQVVKQCYLEKVDNETFVLFFELLMETMWNNNIKRRSDESSNV